MDNPEADAIRSRMAALRARASGRAYRLTRETSKFLDWKHYVRLFPWLMVGAAAGLGYFIIPSRRRAPTPQIEYIHGEPIRPGVIAAPVVSEPVPRETLFGSMMQMAKNAIWRAASTYVGQQLGGLLVNGQQQPDDSAEKVGKSNEYGRGHYV